MPMVIGFLYKIALIMIAIRSNLSPTKHTKSKSYFWKIYASLISANPLEVAKEKLESGQSLSFEELRLAYDDDDEYLS